MSSKYQELTIAFSRRLLTDCLPVPATLLKHYRSWGLNEQDLIVLLRIIRPLVSEGRVAADRIAAEFGLPLADVPLLVQPFTDNQMLVQEGDDYNADGLMRDLFQLWLDEQSQEPPPAPPKRLPSAALGDKEQIRQLSRLYRRFEADLGRNLGQTENERLRSWLNDERIAPELIEEALKRAKLHNKASFAYIDSILGDWRAKGFTSLEMVRRLDAKTEPSAPKKPRAAAKKTEKSEFDLVYEEMLKP